MKKNIYILSSVFLILFALLPGVSAVESSPLWSECRQNLPGYNVNNCRNRAILFKQIGGPIGRPDEVWYQWAVGSPRNLAPEVACALAPNAVSCNGLNPAIGSGPAILFDPGATTAGVGQNFTVAINVDTFNNQTLSTDAYVQYDASAVQFVQLTNGDFYPSVRHSDQQGVLSIGGMVNTPASSSTGTGRLATVTFKALKEVVTRLSIVCGSGSTASSKIVKNDIDATNIIDCSANNQMSVKIGNATATPTGPVPTGPTQGVTGTATPAITGTITPTSVTGTPAPCPEYLDDHDDDGKDDKDDDDDDNDKKKDKDDDDGDDDGKPDKDKDCRDDEDHDGERDDDDDDNDKSKLKLMIMLTILLFIMLTVILGL